MSTIQQAYIVAATRTPIGRAPRGMLSHQRPDDLLARVIQGVLAQAPGLDPAAIEDAIVGCAIPEGPQGLNVARIGALLAGLPSSVPGVTVNRFCASGLTAIAMAADRIRVGEADVLLAAGVESMSQVPTMGVSTSFSPNIFAHDENLAQQAGEFTDEMLPLDIVNRVPDLRSGKVAEIHKMVSLDEGPRPDTSLEALAKLRPVFAARGSVTAGNSSQISDGAGALLVVSERALKIHGLTPLARFVTFAVRGVPPEIMGIGPKEAIPRALRHAGLKLDQMGWIELNEAFAAQSLAVIRDLGLNPDIVNPMGGAIALGHPLGATGAIRAATVIHGIRRRKFDYGMLTMCVGTGMGAAGIFERL